MYVSSHDFEKVAEHTTASNIDMAIKACRPESGNLIRNREEMRQVKESLNEGYCDISGRVGDLQKIGLLISIFFSFFLSY